MDQFDICPGELPESFTDNLFSSPLRCPVRLPTPRYSSPNSSLSPEELEKLRMMIMETNDKLIDPTAPAMIRQHFQKLIGEQLELEIHSGGNKVTLRGMARYVGSDFLLLSDRSGFKLVPLSKVVTGEHPNHGQEMEESGHGQRHANISPSLRRDLVLNFGRTVAENPQMENLFFGIPLLKFSAKLLGRRIAVTTDDASERTIGRLINIKPDFFTLRTATRTAKIQLPKICVIAF